MAYRIEITKSAERQIGAIDKAARIPLLLHLYQLALDPRPSSGTLIDDEEEVYRLNIGGYVFTYWIREKFVVILSLDVESNGRK